MNEEYAKIDAKYTQSDRPSKVTSENVRSIE